MCVLCKEGTIQVWRGEEEDGKRGSYSFFPFQIPRSYRRSVADEAAVGWAWLGVGWTFFL